MSLRCEMQGKVLHVTEFIHGGFRGDDIIRHWYYDTESWLKSSNGNEGDKPDRIMNQDSIERDCHG